MDAWTFRTSTCYQLASDYELHLDLFCCLSTQLNTCDALLSAVLNLLQLVQNLLFLRPLLQHRAYTRPPIADSKLSAGSKQFLKLDPVSCNVLLISGGKFSYDLSACQPGRNCPKQVEL